MARAWHAFAVYVVAALVGTWPLARGLGRQMFRGISATLFLNMWILVVGLRADPSHSVGRLFTHCHLLRRQHHPGPLSLAYSEHLILKRFKSSPVYLISQNPILCYNLLFLSDNRPFRTGMNSAV